MERFKKFNSGADVEGKLEGGKDEGESCYC
jgi:hypothetical protein